MDERQKAFKSDFSGLDLRNEDVFLSLYDFFAPRLLKHAIVRLGSADEAKDVVSHVFLKAWEYVADATGGKKSIRNIKAFLYQIANNHIIDTYRKKFRTDVSLDSLPFAEELGGLAEEVEQRSHNVFDGTLVLGAMESIRREYKEILVWRYVDDLNISEIAIILGASRAAVSVKLYRALADLKKTIKRKGFIS